MMGFGFGGLGLIGMIVFWVLLIVAVIWLAKWLFPTTQASASNQVQQTDSAEDILKQRYARGEISKEQYQQMRQTIHDGVE